MVMVALLLAMSAGTGAAPAPTFADAAEVEQFVLASDDEGVQRALETALTLSGARDMIGLAAKMGPAYAAKVAGMLPDPGFREGYGDLAKYLDLFGPCQKKQAAGTEGWWSNYPEPPFDHYCTEATKLLFSALLWNQVHYCERLASGADTPKVPVASGKLPPYRLDEPPVATHWVHADVLYAVADAAVRFEFAKTLRARGDGVPEKLRGAMLRAAAELERDPVNREAAALAIAKLLVRRYEQTHIEHLARLNAGKK